MRKILWSVWVLAVLSGCATNPLPKDYGGPIATVRDTAISETPSRAHFYYLDQINGQTIPNVIGETRKANHGRGFSLNPVSYQREVPAQTSELKLKARVGYGAPIHELLNASTVYSTERVVNVKLESNKSYVVKGVLTATRQDVWLEDAMTGKRVD